MGFSTLHTLSGRVGKPVGPETIRFDAYMTNVAVGFAGLDGHPVEIEVYSGAADSYDDLGELLLKESVPLSDGLVRHELVDSQNIFVDCVRRLVISSTAKIFLLDDLEYGPSATDCATRAAEAAAAKAEPTPRPARTARKRRGRRRRARAASCGGGGGAGGGEARGKATVTPRVKLCRRAAARNRRLGAEPVA